MHAELSWLLSVYPRTIESEAVTMKYSINTYRLYNNESRYAFSIRVKVTMKDTVDAEILNRSVNTAILRYPYYCVKVAVDSDGGYILLPNSAPVAVLPVSRRTRMLGGNDVGEHLLFVEYEGKDIFLNISHSLCGGKGALPWVMTTIWQYVKDRYHFEPKAPGIRKPGEPLLEGETAELTMEMLSKEPPIAKSISKHPVIMISDYLNGLYNPFMRNPNYTLFSFHQKDVVDFIKSNDSSVVSFFLIVMAKALNNVLPEKHRVIGGETAHFPGADFGIPNTHCDLLSHVYLDYERDQLNWDMEKLGTMTRGQILWQTDPTVSSEQIRNLYQAYEEADRISGLAEKRKYLSRNNPSNGSNARHGTYILNYTGRMDWGETADYVDSYCAIVEGHLLGEVTSMENQIFLSVMQLIKTDKYINAIRSVLDELRIPYKVEGPFPKHLSRHKIPLR